jgi:hypothetical protein
VLDDFDAPLPEEILRSVEKKSQAAIDLLQSWMDEEDTGEDAEAWNILKTRLN